ncbi:hypothetical protein CC77DRAFT_1026046 [Alternaria alternata]|uniref:Uncharacterized protein n=1 Tax=Alternaria alternata TaxID=5599 RepID=A0A177D5K7_ALTAL|nr:hypothetical protein CC77DRAFT_1026046 [Alternaria alternata]OAG14209.1 hypothetical protein CC77DRAFT_1026046 [Alternaria alternata]
MSFVTGLLPLHLSGTELHTTAHRCPTIGRPIPSQRVTAAPNPIPLYTSLPVEQSPLPSSSIFASYAMRSLTAVNNANMTIPHAPHPS